MHTSKLCSAVPDPRQCHYDAGLVVAGYLWATKDLGIIYGGKLRVPLGLATFPPGFHESCGLYTAHDSSWGTCADLFTKALDKGQFYKLRDVMMNHHAPLRDALSVAMCQMHGSASRLAQRLSRQL